MKQSIYCTSHHPSRNVLEPQCTHKHIQVEVSFDCFTFLYGSYNKRHHLPYSTQSTDHYHDIIHNVAWLPLLGYHCSGTTAWVSLRGYHCLGTIAWLPLLGYHCLGTIARRANWPFVVLSSPGVLEPLHHISTVSPQLLGMVRII